MCPSGLQPSPSWRTGEDLAALVSPGPPALPPPMGTVESPGAARGAALITEGEHPTQSTWSPLCSEAQASRGIALSERGAGPPADLSAFLFPERQEQGAHA